MEDIYWGLAALEPVDRPPLSRSAPRTSSSMAEHQTFNLLVLGSSPRGCTTPLAYQEDIMSDENRVVPIRPDRENHPSNPEFKAKLTSVPDHDPDPLPEFWDGVCLTLTALFLVGFWTGVGMLLYRHLF